MTGTLKILLDPPYKRANFKSQLFIPGDTVSGKVVLDLKDNEKIDSICIELKGKFRILSGRGQDDRAYEVDMFRQRKILFQGPFKLRASTYDYPFSFQFPKHFKHDYKEFAEDAFFLGQTKVGPHPLPPTCEDKDIRSGMCAIYYILGVKIPRTFGSWEDNVSLYFTPSRTARSPAPLLKSSKDYATLQRQFRLTNEGIPRPLTTREAIKEAFRHQTGTYTVNFSLSVLAPTAIVIGKPYEIEVTLVSNDVETGNSMPSFLMKDYSLFLKSRTEVRAPGAAYDLDCFLEGLISLSGGNLDLPLAINVPMKVNGMFPVNQSYAPPSFTSWAIRRTYALELRSMIFCLGEGFKCNVHCPNVTLYSARIADEVEEATRSIEVRAANLSLVNQEGLPAYGEATGMGRRREDESLPVYEAVITGNT